MRLPQKLLSENLLFSIFLKSVPVTQVSGIDTSAVLARIQTDAHFETDLLQEQYVKNRIKYEIY
jgi:hypothetical protein